MLQELRFASRSLRRNWASSAAVILCLSFGIGLNAAVFSYVNRVLLNPLPYADPSRLLVLWGTESFDTARAINGRYLEEWTSSPKELEAIAGFELIPFSVSVNSNRVESVKATRVQPDVFRVLGVQASRGRAFTEDDAETTGPTPVLISHDLWNGVFARDEKILGSTVRLDDTSYTVIGVMPSGFFFPDLEVEIWMPIFSSARANRELQYIGRMKPGASLSQVREEFAVALRGLPPGIRERFSPGVFPYRRLVIGEHEKASWLLFASVWVLLLASCANVSNWLLARGIQRNREIAVRLSLGASRWRHLGSLLAEPLLLTVLSGVMSILWAYGAIKIFRAADLAGVGLVESLSLDWETAGYIAATAAIAGVAAGIAPLLMTGQNIQGAFRTGYSSTPSRGSRRLRQLLLGIEVALAVLLLVSSALLVKSFAAMASIDWGFRPDGVVAVETRLQRVTEGQTARYNSFVSQVLDKLRATPGVQSASAAAGVPIKWSSWQPSLFDLGGRAFDGGVWVVGSDYFKTLGVQILAGREFSQLDPPAANHVVVNETFAQRAWGGKDPLSRRIVLLKPRKDLQRSMLPGQMDPRQVGESSMWEAASPPLTVIGVTRDVRMFGLGYTTGAVAYFDIKSRPLPRITFAVRTTDGDELKLVPILSTQIQAVDPTARINSSFSMADAVAGSIAGRGSLKLVTLASVLLGGLALVLSVTGVYGVVSLLVAQRIREVAVMKALGATRKQISMALLGPDSITFGLAIVAGIAGAVAAARVMRSLLFGVTPLDLEAYAFAIVLILAGAVVATIGPVRRAFRLNPAELLRIE